MKPIEYALYTKRTKSIVPLFSSQPELVCLVFCRLLTPFKTKFLRLGTHFAKPRHLISWQAMEFESKPIWTFPIMFIIHSHSYFLHSSKMFLIFQTLMEDEGAKLNNTKNNARTKLLKQGMLPKQAQKLGYLIVKRYRQYLNNKCR